MQIINTPKSRLELAKYFATLGFTTGAEIGVATGYYSEYLFKSIPNLKLYCIDPYTDKSPRRDGHFETMVKKLKPYNYTLLKMTSAEALSFIENESLDFVYIDGNHKFKYVLQDIEGWSQKVRTGGIVSGHDYYDFRTGGVVEAVNLYVKKHNIDLHIIPKYQSSYKDDSFPNYWWFKTQ